MCGITGIINLKNETPGIKHQIIKMSDAIRHRGPDDEGYLLVSKDELTTCGGKDTQKSNYEMQFKYSPKKDILEIDNGYSMVLGHRRLSILDLSAAGHQPMCSEDGKIWIVHNGEIYNYIELREELKAKGYTFISKTDTEVIIKSYQEWGDMCIGKFNGMWAFALLDFTKNILFCSRDRFGVKPFYYYYDPNYFVFSSEIKALLTLPFVDKSVNKALIYNYLLWNISEDGEKTFYKSIRRLKHSHNLVLDLRTGKISTSKYYELNYNHRFGSFIEGDAEHYSNIILEKIIKAVNIRLRSDVPIGACLSGGIDSSTLFLMADRSVKSLRNQKAFTSCFYDKRYDESDYARKIINMTGADWCKVYPEADEFWKDIQKLIDLQDEPFIGTSIYAQYRVMKMAGGNGIKVMIDGQGGDELFAGYKSYIEAYLLDFIGFNKNISSFFGELKKIKKHSPANNLKEIIHLLSMMFIKNNLPDWYVNSLNRSRKSEFGYLNNEFISEYRKYDKGYPRDIKNGLNHILWQDITGANLQKLLKWEDINSMAFSIETRMPFADDHELMEYVFSIPSQYKIHDGWTKYLLRKSMSGIVPETIRLRKDKMGFETSEIDWIIKNKEKFKEIFSDKAMLANDFMDTKKIIKNFEKVLKHTNNYGITDIWRFINLAMWLK